MFESCEDLLAEVEQLEQQLAKADVHADQALARRLGRRYAELRPVVAAYREWKSVNEDLQAAAELGEVDEAFAAEVPVLTEREREAAERLTALLLPRDPLDDKDVILEIKAGRGGGVGPVRRRPAAHVPAVCRAAWLEHPGDRGGGIRPGWLQGRRPRREGTRDPRARRGALRPTEVRGRGPPGPARPGDRIQGGIHTSAAGVLVLPEAEEVDVVVDPNDLRIDVYRSSGPGGQSVNTTDLAVRITHLPSGLVVSCQNEKSQLQNKEQAMRILRARLLALAEEAAASAASDARRSQVRTVDRSERIRTYNFPENRISDHRVNFKAYNLDQVLDGDLEVVVSACLEADHAARLASGDARVGS
jgi:peptide chain release factor 1